MFASRFLDVHDGIDVFALRRKIRFMKTTLFAAFLFSLVISAHAAPLSADQLMTQAAKRAVAEKKMVYLHFSASWCSWCKKHDAFLEQPEVKAAFEKYFVPVKMVVQEKEENKELENAGAEAWLKKAGGPEGLPYSAFFDAKEMVIVNSKRATEKGSGNIGHPFAPEEIDWFVTMMKRAAPAMTAVDLKVIEDALRAQKK
jgi:hypothetical protein